MTDEQPTKRRGLIGFYIGIGAALLLFVGGWAASGPLRAWYWEREVRRWMPMQGLIPGAENPHVRPVVKLIAVGPPARAAVERLFQENDTALHECLTVVLADPKNTWALPVLIEQIKKPEKSDDSFLVDTIKVISGKDFYEGLGKNIPNADGRPVMFYVTADI